jgi:hypothetical protein
MAAGIRNDLAVRIIFPSLALTRMSLNMSWELRTFENTRLVVDENRASACSPISVETELSLWAQRTALSMVQHDTHIRLVDTLRLAALRVVQVQALAGRGVLEPKADVGIRNRVRGLDVSTGHCERHPRRRHGLEPTNLAIEEIEILGKWSTRRKVKNEKDCGHFMLSVAVASPLRRCDPTRCPLRHRPERSGTTPLLLRLR